MIYLYSGVPGSGKSYHTSLDIIEYAKTKDRFVITNLNIDYNKLSKVTKISPEDLKNRVFYKKNEDITVDFLKHFSVDNLERGKENRCLLAFDEAGDKFNARSFDADDRTEWLEFFRVHRHFGYKILLVAQHDRYLDRQIRGCIQTEIEHRSFKYYKTFGLILYTLLGGLFQTIWYNYPMKGQSRMSARTGSSILKLHKRKASIYNTFQCYDDFINSLNKSSRSSTNGALVFTPKGTPLVEPVNDI